MQVKKQQLELDMVPNRTRLVPNRKRSMSRLCIVTLLIELICRVHHEKCRLDEAQARIKLAGRNINILRYADEKEKDQKVKKN